jgi:hypothetical protein
MDTKTVSGRGSSFLNSTIANHEQQGWKVEQIDRSTLGKFWITFRREAGATVSSVPKRPD